MENGLKTLIEQMNMAKQKEHNVLYKELFLTHDVSTLDELKSKLFDDLRLTYKGNSMNVYEGKLKDRITLSQQDIAFICDSENYGSQAFIREDGTFKVTVYID